MCFFVIRLYNPIYLNLFHWHMPKYFPNIQFVLQQ
jgi:hypothetical protein